MSRMYQENASSAPFHSRPGHDRANPHVAEPHLRVRHEVVHEADDEDEQQRRRVADGQAAQDIRGPESARSTPANQLAPTTCDALTSSSATSRIAPATISITNENSLCFQKLRCFSTPHA